MVCSVVKPRNRKVRIPLYKTRLILDILDSDVDLNAVRMEVVEQEDTGFAGGGEFESPPKMVLARLLIFLCDRQYQEGKCLNQESNA
jgi:hypothetical protein